MKAIPCTARQLRTGHRTPFEPSALTVKYWYPSQPGDKPAVLLQRGRKQYLFDLASAYELVNEITDAAEQLEAAEAQEENH